jgi:hypothetical protein
VDNVCESPALSRIGERIMLAVRLQFIEQICFCLRMLLMAKPATRENWLGYLHDSHHHVLMIIYNNHHKKTTTTHSRRVCWKLILCLLLSCWSDVSAKVVMIMMLSLLCSTLLCLPRPVYHHQSTTSSRDYSTIVSSAAIKLALRLDQVVVVCSGWLLVDLHYLNSITHHHGDFEKC